MFKTSCLNIARTIILSSVAALAMLTILPCQAWTQDTQQPADSTVDNSRQGLRQRLPEGFMDSTSSILPAHTQSKRKSPGGALLRSMAIPGWGQFYTEHHIRGTITAVAETAFLVGMVLEFRDRSDLRDKLSGLEKQNGPDWPVDDPERVLLNNQIKNAQRKAGDYMAYGATALLLGMLDSYVSAHLYNFDHHFGLGPDGNARVAVAIKF